MSVKLLTALEATSQYSIVLFFGTGSGYPPKISDSEFQIRLSGILKSVQATKTTSFKYEII